MSHPSWVRGLKSKGDKATWDDAVSHPSWVRGLKSIGVKDIPVDPDVAPFMGAWIEIAIRNRR